MLTFYDIFLVSILRHGHFFDDYFFEPKMHWHFIEGSATKFSHRDSIQNFKVCFWNSIDCMIFDANFFLPNAHIGVNSIILYKLQYYSIDLYATSKRNQKNKMSLQTAKVKYVREWVDGVESHFKDCWRHHTKYNTILWFLSKEDHNLIIIIKYVDNVGRAYVYD